jgi:hypothetical protein
MSARTRLDGQGGGSEGMLQWRRWWRKKGRRRGVSHATETPPGFTHMEGSVGEDKVKVKVKLAVLWS